MVPTTARAVKIEATTIDTETGIETEMTAVGIGGIETETVPPGKRRKEEEVEAMTANDEGREDPGGTLLRPEWILMPQHSSILFLPLELLPLVHQEDKEVCRLPKPVKRGGCLWGIFHTKPKKMI